MLHCWQLVPAKMTLARGSHWQLHLASDPSLRLFTTRFPLQYCNATECFTASHWLQQSFAEISEFSQTTAFGKNNCSWQCFGYSGTMCKACARRHLLDTRRIEVWVFTWCDILLIIYIGTWLIRLQDNMKQLRKNWQDQYYSYWKRLSIG